jgi:hypothetical protein
MLAFAGCCEAWKRKKIAASIGSLMSTSILVTRDCEEHQDDSQYNDNQGQKTPRLSRQLSVLPGRERAVIATTGLNA